MLVIFKISISYLSCFIAIQSQVKSTSIHDVYNRAIRLDALCMTLLLLRSELDSRLLPRSGRNQA